MRSGRLLICFAVACLLFCLNDAIAQMVSPDVFLQGRYVEVGIGNLGYYGSDTAAPAGYHAHLSFLPIGTGQLGFVVDYGKDGWTVGTPQMMGDYFLPGVPYEGWELQVGTKRCQAFNNGPGTAFIYSGGMPPCTGSNTSYSIAGSKITGTWQGTVDSITVTQITTLDTNDLFFTVKVILTNTSVAPKDSIYYFRTVDPDNDETWPGGSYATYNKIEHQVVDTTVVSATGRSGAYTMMALGTTDTPATAVIYDNWPLAATTGIDSLFNQTYTPADYTQGTKDNGDIAIGLVLKVAHLATVDSATDSVARKTATDTRHPANSASFTFFYSFGTEGLDSAIATTIRAKPVDTSTTPPTTSTLGINNINNTAIKVYPNPSKNIINITGLTPGDRVTVYDMMGRQLNLDWQVNGGTLNTFPMNNVPAGAYILTVIDANGSVKARLPVRKL